MKNTEQFRKKERKKTIQLMFDMLDNIYKTPAKKQEETLPKKESQIKLF